MIQIVKAICTAAGDEEEDDRLRAAQDTCAKVEAGVKEITGFKTLTQMLPDNVVQQAAKWLDVGIRKSNRENTQQMFAGIGPTVESAVLHDENLDLSAFVDMCSTVHIDNEATHNELAKAMISILSVAGKYPPVGADGRIYILNEKANIWRPKDMDEVQANVAECFDGKEMTRCRTGGHYKAIADQIRVHVKREQFFHDAPRGAALGGQFYRLNNDGQIVIEPLHPMHRQLFIIQTTPIQGEMPRFEQYLNETFAGDDQQGQVQLFQEICGSVLFGIMPYHHKAALFIGPGRTGKTTAQKLLQHMVPKEYRTACSPFRWEEPYYLASLAGKRLNLVGELPEDRHIPAAPFKNLIGADYQQARDPYGKPFTFQNEAAHIFNSNHLVNTRDRSSAFFSRWLIVEFRNIVPKEKQDKLLAEAISSSELPQILHWAVEGAQRLIAQNQYTETETQIRIMNKWQVNSDSVLAFLESDSVTTGKSYSVIRRALYSAYRDWCEGEGRLPLGRKNFHDRLDDPVIVGRGIYYERTSSAREVKGVKLVEYGAPKHENKILWL